jgi:short-subunit dehydrogenase
MIGNKDSYALVTGASSGIGYELAKLFARDGKNIVVVARSKDKLEELKGNLEKEHGTKVRVLPKDLSNPKAPQEIFSELEKEGINVDVLVNNAGFAVYGMFSDSDWQKEAEMIQVNITALTALTKLFLKKMLEDKSGKIMNISSVGGFIPAPWYSMYHATKAYVLSFSEALANEVKGTGVSVTCFCPGVTKTLFYERANAEKSKALKSRVLSMDAATVARLGYKALAKGKVTAIAGLPMSLAVFFSRFAPRSLVARMARATVAPT